MFGNLVVSMLVRGCVDGPAERADVISLQGVSTARRIAGDVSPEHADSKGVKGRDTARERVCES